MAPRPSDFSDGTWEDRYSRDLERVGSVRPAPRVTADDKAERFRLRSAAFTTDEAETEPFLRVEEGRS